MSDHMEEKQCEMCEEIKMCYYDVDPYAHELCDDDRKMWICNECYSDRAESI